MEDIQRDLEKEITAVNAPRSARKNKRWTLMFVGDHGRVVTIRWFRGVAILWGISLLLALVVAGVFYFLFVQARDLNLNLQQSLNNIEQRFISVTNEKEILMARLVIAEAELERLRFKGTPQNDKKTSENQTEVYKETEVKTEKTAEQPIVETAPVQDSDASSDSERQASASGVIKQRVSVEDFSVYHEPHNNAFRAQFILKNADTHVGPISGYTAVILKQDEDDSQADNWLTLPSVKLDSGVPTGNKKGQYFSIARFKTVRFNVKSKIDPKSLKGATVFVFDTNDALILEKDFSIDIPDAVFIPKG